MHITKYVMRTKLLSIFIVGAALGLTSCATDEASGYNPDDPFEDINRQVYAFNGVLDSTLLKPTARFYRDHTPEPIQTCAGNFFNNLNEPVRAASHLAILNLNDAGRSVNRFLTNTFLGALGCVDMNRDPVPDNDLGIALRYWSDDETNTPLYLVMPIFGPSTPGDFTGSLIESYYLDPLRWSRLDGEDVSNNARNGQSWIRRNPYDISSPDKRTGVYVYQVINLRSELLDATDFIDEVALDRYAFTRDAWRDQRDGLVAELKE